VLDIEENNSNIIEGKHYDFPKGEMKFKNVCFSYPD